jgi:hypothetical protein
MERKQITPRLHAGELPVGHAGVVERPGQIEAEVVRATQDSQGVIPGSIAISYFKTPLLLLLGNDVEENPRAFG